jgi:hypothetical protein
MATSADYDYNVGYEQNKQDLRTLHDNLIRAVPGSTVYVDQWGRKCDHLYCEWGQDMGRDPHFGTRDTSCCVCKLKHQHKLPKKIENAGVTVKCPVVDPVMMEAVGKLNDENLQELKYQVHKLQEERKKSSDRNEHWLNSVYQSESYKVWMKAQSESYLKFVRDTVCFR